MIREEWALSGRANRAQQYGLAGEAWAMAQLESRGHQVEWMADFQAHFDLLVDNILPVEVKIASARRRYVRKGYYRQAWEFNLRRGLKAGEVDYILVAVCDTKDGYIPFIIPSAWLVAKQYLRITTHPDAYKGYVSPARRNWGAVDELLTRVRNCSHNITLPRNDISLLLPRMI